MMEVQLKKFRAYSQTTTSGGGSSQTSSGGSSSGSTSQSTGGGGTSVTASIANEAKSSNVPSWNYGSAITSSAQVTDAQPQGRLATNVPSSDNYAYHGHNVLEYNGHSHGITLSQFNHNHDISHTHTTNVSGGGSHSHTFNIGAHTHTVNIPAHTHDITAGIFEQGNLNAFGIYVGGQLRASVSGTSWEGDIVEWIAGDKGMIPRNSWIELEIRPNDLAYVVSSVFVQGFCRSRGGGNY